MICISDITPELIEQYQRTVEKESSSLLAMNACFKTDPLEMCVRRTKFLATNHIFNHKVGCVA